MKGCPDSSLLDFKEVEKPRRRASVGGGECDVKGGQLVHGSVSLIVKGALLPGHGLNGAWHRGRLERGRSIRMERMADGVDGGQRPLGGQRESVLVLRHGVGAQPSVSRAHLLYLRHQGLEQGVG